MEKPRKSPASAASGAPEPRRGAYTAGLALLARRELSEQQVRQRLSRRGYEAEDIDTAVARLKADRSLDDRRVAGAIARTEVNVRGRGPQRVRRSLEAAGIRGVLADAALDETFAAIDPDALIEAALDRRLRGRERIADDREMQRLYRYLVSQGFASDRILALLRSRR